MMQTELEAKFLSVDHQRLRARLKKLGATRVQPMQLMRRRNYDYPDGRLQKIGGWVRVRDEGNKITLSYKRLHNRTLTGTKEVCLTVDSFDQAGSFLEAIGLRITSYQETKRESWRLDDVEVELDEWPWIKPFVELEAYSEAALRKAADGLGLTWVQAVHGSVEIAYQAEFDVSEIEIDTVGSITFDDPVPHSWQARRKAVV